MRVTHSLSFAISVALAVVTALPTSVMAQQVTTATIAGRVLGVQQEQVEGAVVRVVNAATGYAFLTVTRNGKFSIPGLPVGGPYTIVVERIGYRTAKHDNIFLTLGEHLPLVVTLLTSVIELDTLQVVAIQRPVRSNAGGGIGMAISDSKLHRLPTIDRDLYDFARLTPQISARSGRVGLSGGGVGGPFQQLSG
jgi:hypothetical protein